MPHNMQTTDNDSWNDSASRSKSSRGWGCLGSLLVLLAIVIIIALTLPRLVPTVNFSLFGSKSATPTPAPIIITIDSITPLAELATVSYKTMADITNERIPNDIRKDLGAKEQIVMLVYGEVKAGFDLSKLTDKNIWVDGKRVQLTLPPPEILSTAIDYERTRIVTYKKSFLVGNDPELEQETLKLAKKAIIKSALEGDVLEMARNYGRLYFENYLRSLGFEEVKVIVQ